MAAMSIVAYGPEGIGPKSNIQAHRLFDRRRINCSTKFDSTRLARFLVIFWTLISAVPVAVAGGADTPQLKRGLILRLFGRDIAPFSAMLSSLRTELVPLSHRISRGIVGTTLGRQVDHAID